MHYQASSMRHFPDEGHPCQISRYCPEAGQDNTTFKKGNIYSEMLDTFCSTERKINNRQEKMTADNFIPSIQNLTEFSRTSNRRYRPWGMRQAYLRSTTITFAYMVQMNTFNNCLLIMNCPEELLCYGNNHPTSKEPHLYIKGEITLSNNVSLNWHLKIVLDKLNFWSEDFWREKWFSL